MQQFKIEVFGLVQEVSFRYHTAEYARQLGLCGFVKNRADGSVYIEAEGDAAALEALVKWCHRGPELAQVERVAVQEGICQHYLNFQVRYS